MIDIKAVIVADLLGLVAIYSVIAGNSWILSKSNRESKYIKAMLIASGLSCVMDAVSFWVDGRSGELYRFLNFFSNTWVFAMNLVIPPLWLFFLSYHIKGKVDRLQKYAVALLEVIGVCVLTLNLFLEDLAFGIDESNIYSRGPFYYYFLAVEIICMLYSVYLYIDTYRKGGMLKFFPVWVFLIPITLGMLFQSLFYGISLIWACLAISVSGILSCLQNEMIYQDELTGIYNRYYFDMIYDKLRQSRKTAFTVMMLDLNDFKSINDSYGHTVGDEALINAAEIIREAVGAFGSAIRYAGDEFVVVLNSAGEEEALQCSNAIRTGFDAFNADGKNQYVLSASVGYDIVDIKAQTADDIMKDIDSKMYEDKKRYYQTHKKNR